jgi:DNA-binding transcriptional ArsR family regulator
MAESFGDKRTERETKLKSDAPNPSITPASIDIKAASELLFALSHPSRYHIVHLLLGREWYVNELCHEVGMSQPNMTQHLKIIREAGLAQTRRQAQTVYYSCASKEAKAILLTVQTLFPLRPPKI